MQFLTDAGTVLAAYLFGSIPFGLLVVKATNGKDIRTVESGRTGGTNAFRAAGFRAGLFTAILDILKAAVTVWLAQAITGNVWVHVLAPIAAVLGHNHSIFLPERGPVGRLRLRGGAGGAAALGGTFGLWPPAVLIMLPLGILIWWGIGFASVTTLSVGLMTMIIFAVRAALGLAPWEYVLYGLLAELLMLWALRPNIKRLFAGTERRHGLPVKLQKLREKRKQAKSPGGKRINPEIFTE
ncbi:MAG: glycerol-3-phosphate acyltransferase [Chloroflexi bacterium]|nr:glycerol-3-phosphate acyltransferase [Chloroflexota bacterium]